jgi:hypothetical protein
VVGGDMKAMLHTACGCSRWIEIEEKNFFDTIYVAIHSPAFRGPGMTNQITAKKRTFKMVGVKYDFEGRYPEYEEILEER